MNKFRHYDTHNKEIVYSDSHKDDGCYYVNPKGILFCYAYPKTDNYYKSYNVDRFTTIKDLNGKDVYENDIVTFFVPDNRIPKLSQLIKTGIVKMINGCWCVDKYEYKLYNCILEVKTNIYEKEKQVVE